MPPSANRAVVQELVEVPGFAEARAMVATVTAAAEEAEEAMAKARATAGLQPATNKGCERAT